MKKNIVLVSAIALFLIAITSCKGKIEQTPTATTTTVETSLTPETPTVASALVNSITVPTFADAEVTKFCESFKILMTEYAGLKDTGDKTKAEALNQKFTEWGNSAASFAGKVKPEEMQKFNDFLVEAQKKFMEMSTDFAK